MSQMATNLVLDKAFVWLQQVILDIYSLNHFQSRFQQHIIISWSDWRNWSVDAGILLKATIP